MSTFYEACRLACRQPQSTEEAQYSLPFSVAAALVYGQLGPDELSGAALSSAAVLRLSDRVELVEEPAFSACFPRERIARVQIEINTGVVLDSGETQARWDAADPPTDEELREKFRWLASGRIPARRAAELEELVWHCAELPEAGALVNRLGMPLQESGHEPNGTLVSDENSEQ